MSGVKSFPPGVVIFQDGTAVDSGNPLATTATFTGSISVGSVSLLAGTNDIGAVEQAGTWSVALNAGTNSIGSAVLGASTADIGNVGILTNAPDVVQVLTLDLNDLGNATTLTLGAGQANVVVNVGPFTGFFGGALKVESTTHGNPGLSLVGPLGASALITSGTISSPGQYQIGGVSGVSEIFFHTAATAAVEATLTCELSTASPLDAVANFALSNLGNAITAPGTASLTAALTVQGSLTPTGTQDVLVEGGTLSVLGIGTAGTADTHVITVQGIASATPVPIKGALATYAAAAASEVVNSGTAVTIFGTLAVTNGFFIANPKAATTPLYVDFTTTAGTAEAGTTMAIQPGNSFQSSWPPAGAVSANATDSTHNFVAFKW